MPGTQGSILRLSVVPLGRGVERVVSRSYAPLNRVNRLTGMIGPAAPAKAGPEDHITIRRGFWRLSRRSARKTAAVAPSRTR